MPTTDALTTYLREEISASDLSQLLDEHLHTMIQVAAITGEPISEEQASVYHHLRRLRDLFAAMKVEPVMASDHEHAA
jgi:DNA-binding transcriptional ArsR family regulator